MLFRSAKEVLLASTIISKQAGKKILINMDYNSVGKIQYILATMQIECIDTIYKEDVDMIIVVPNEQVDQLRKKILEATSAKAGFEEQEDVYYANADGKLLLFNE